MAEEREAVVLPSTVLVTVIVFAVAFVVGYVVLGARPRHEHADE